MSNKPTAGTWIKKALQNIKPEAEMIILENPHIRDVLDEHIREIWPSVKKHLKSTGSIYTPSIKMKIESESTHALVRSMTWMLHDPFQAIHRGCLECRRDFWVLRSEFFLSIPSSADLSLIREIIGNSRFGGNPPALTIHKHNPAAYYQVVFHTGIGESWGPGSRERIVNRIKACIDCNVSMYEYSIDGEWDQQIVEDFLSTAFTFYESH